MVCLERECEKKLGFVANLGFGLLELVSSPLDQIPIQLEQALNPAAILAFADRKALGKKRTDGIHRSAVAPDCPFWVGRRQRTPAAGTATALKASHFQ